MAGTKRVVLRAIASADVEAAVDGYLDDAGAEVALRYLDALQAAYGHVARHPATGSPRWGHALNIPELRTWPLSRFPFLVFYVEQAERVEVWRVLHMARDISAALADESGGRPR